MGAGLCEISQQWRDASPWRPPFPIHSPQVFFLYAMTVTHEDGGRLNAFAREPKMVLAEPLTGAEQRQRLRFYGLGAVLVMTTVAITAWVSRGLV